LWRTDGTLDGTVQIGNFDLTIDFGRSSIFDEQDVIEFDNSILFFAGESSFRRNQLWITDGTFEGTREIFGSAPDEFLNTNSNFGFQVIPNGVVFSSRLPDNGTALWLIDGVSENATLLRSFSDEFSFVRESIALDNLLIFSASDGVIGEELWVTNGTADGTQPCSK